MQITIKSTRIIKEGIQDKSKQPYTWVSVMADDGSEKGTEYTTFDAGVLKLGPGSVIDIGDPETKGGKLSFKKIVSVVTEVAASAAPTDSAPTPLPVSGAYKRDVEGIRFEYQCKAQIVKGERASIEAQTAYNGIIELAKTYREDPDLSEAFKEAIAWARQKMAASLANQGSPEPAGATPAPSTPDPPVETGVSLPYVEPEEPFPHVGALLAWCQTYGVDRPTFLEITSSTEKTLPQINIGEAFKLVKAHIIQKQGDQAEAGIFGQPE